MTKTHDGDGDDDGEMLDVVATVFVSAAEPAAPEADGEVESGEGVKALADLKPMTGDYWTKMFDGGGDDERMMMTLTMWMAKR